MQILRKSLTCISRFRVEGSAAKFGHCRTVQNRLLSTAAPVKLAFNVYNQSGTDENSTPVIIMHGLFGSKQNWRTTAKGLNSKTKRKIYVTDLRNHGESPRDDNHTTAHLCEDLHLLIQNENLHRASIIGHSMGGKALMYFSMKYPELVEKAVVVDISPVSIPKDFAQTKQILEAMLKVNIPSNVSLDEGRAIAEQFITNVVDDKKTVDFIMYNLRKSPTGEFSWRLNVESLVRNFENIGNTRRLDFPPFTGPVLFIGGKQSSFIDPDDWPKIKEIFPNAELQWLNTSHLVHIEQPAPFLELVANFLGRQPL